MTTDDTIRFACPHCQVAVKVSAQYAGQKAKCPGCRQVVPIPNRPAPPALSLASVQPAGGPAEMPDVDFATLVEMSMHELQLKTAAHDAAWHLSEGTWDLDQEAGTLVFTMPNGVVATCSAQIVGTFNSKNNSWLWGWDHPSVVPALQEHAKLCRDYGIKHNLDILSYQDIELDNEDGAWQLAAFACKLAGAQGVYRGPAGTTHVFITFGAPQLSKAS